VISILALSFVLSVVATYLTLRLLKVLGLA